MVENSLRSLSLARSTLRSLGRSSHSVRSSDSGIADNEYTHISTVCSSLYPSLWIKIKYPIEADDAARSGMLSSCDFDEILERLQQVFQSWEIHLDAKRMTHYSRHVLPRTLTSEPPRHRIIVKVKFRAWRSSLDVHSIRQAVEDVVNKTGEFFVEIQCQKIKDQ